MEYKNLAYVLAAVLFIIGIKRLSSPKTAQSGNTIASIGMLIAIIATVLSFELLDFKLIGVGIIVGTIIGSTFALRVQMTQMPQMVAIFNGFGGGASALVAAAEYFGKYDTTELGSFISGTIILSVFIGTLTFSGSFIAFGKLQGFVSGKPIVFKGQQIINALMVIGILLLGSFIIFGVNQELNLFYGIVLLALLLGITLTIPIGGADMPVVISLLNSYSGIAASATGFVLMNNGLIISGALVGASGLILTNIMCKGMNRSLANVIFGAVGLDEQTSNDGGEQISFKSSTTDEAAMILDAADKVIIVPGYGLAVAQAQHAAREVADQLEAMGKTVLYAIHPVAGRMPGHMNVLLAEANVPYDKLKDLDDINPEFENCDVAIVLGANDVVNPAARHDTSSPIYGMPILDVDKSRTVIVNKRTMNPGFAGIQNELFGFENTVMVFGDAKEMLTNLFKDLKEL